MEQPFDLVIIGGGTNGPAILLTALLSGIRRVALIERGDVGEGMAYTAANAAATGLIQPGLKYVKSDLSVVRTDALDCRLLKGVGGDLLVEQPFLLPIYRDYAFPYGSPSIWDLYLNAYDPHSAIALHAPHEFLRASQISAVESSLTGGPIAAVRFAEWVTDPVMLSRSFVDRARALGGVVLDKRHVVGFRTRSEQNGRRIESAVTRDRQGRTEDVPGRYFVNACGAWAPTVARMLDIDIRLRPTQGTSIVIGKRLVHSPVVLFDEHRHYVTLLPRGETTVIGPTNVDVTPQVAGNPDLAAPSQQEIDHLLAVANRYVAGPVSAGDIVAVKCGLRPQLNHRGVSPYDITHRFGIFDHSYDGVANFSSLVGGKLTSQLRMAKEITAVACERLGIDFSWRVPEIAPSMLFRERWYRRTCGLYFRGTDTQERLISCASRLQEVRALANLARYGMCYPFKRRRRAS